MFIFSRELCFLVAFHLFLLNEYEVHKHNTGVTVMFLKPVIINCSVLFDSARNTVDEPVQWQHFRLTFIDIESVIRLILFVVLL